MAATLQALSTRVDLLSPPYLAEIERLQDRVQPFPDDVAMQMIATGRAGGRGRMRVLLCAYWDLLGSKASGSPSM